jgi:hypothetical protein
MSQIELITRDYNDADTLLSQGPLMLKIVSIHEIANDVLRNQIDESKFTLRRVNLKTHTSTGIEDISPEDGYCILYKEATKTIIFAFTKERLRDRVMVEIRRILRLLTIQKSFIMNLRDEYMNTDLMHKRISVIYAVAQLLGANVSKSQLDEAFKQYTSNMDLGENALYMTLACHMAAVSIIMKNENAPIDEIKKFAMDLKEAYGIAEESYMKIFTEIAEKNINTELYNDIAEQVYLSLFHTNQDTAMLIVVYRFLCGYLGD